MSRRRRKLLASLAGSPRVINGLAAWLAADAVPLGTVASYTDPLGITYTQGTASARPTNTANQINGKRALVFDGGDSLNWPAALLDVYNGDSTTFVVAKRDVDTGTQGLIASDGNKAVVFYGNAGLCIFRSNQAATSSVTSTGNTTTNFNIIRGRRNGTTQAVSVNGETEITNTSGSNISGVTEGFIGSTDGALNPLTGAIAEILIYNRSLSASEIQAVELYLANKYGIYHPNAAWISNYTPYQQSLIHALKLNRDDAFTDVATNPIELWHDGAQTAVGAVASWDDYSGKDRPSTQGAAAARPIVSTTQNGLNVLSFDGGDTLAVDAELYSIPNGDNAVFVVVRQATASGSVERPLEMNESNSGRYNVQYLATANTVGFTNRTGGAGVSIGGVVTTNFNILTGIRTGTTESISVNGGIAATDTNAASEDGITAGSIGSTVAAGAIFTGSIAEIIILSKSATATERTAINTYLANKWDITT